MPFTDFPVVCPEYGAANFFFCVQFSVCSSGFHLLFSSLSFFFLTFDLTPITLLFFYFGELMLHWIFYIWFCLLPTSFFSLFRFSFLTFTSFSVQTFLFFIFFFFSSFLSVVIFIFDWDNFVADSRVSHSNLISFICSFFVFLFALLTVYLVFFSVVFDPETFKLFFLFLLLLYWFSLVVSPPPPPHFCFSFSVLPKFCFGNRWIHNE